LAQSKHCAAEFRCPLLGVKRTSLSLLVIRRLSAPDRIARRTKDLWRCARFFVAGRGVGGTDKSALEPHRLRERARATVPTDGGLKEARFSS